MNNTQAMNRAAKIIRKQNPTIGEDALLEECEDLVSEWNAELAMEVDTYGAPWHLSQPT